MEENSESGSFLTIWLEKNLTDKTYEKRKNACSEIEQIFSRLSMKSEYENVKKALTDIVSCLIDSKQNVYKKGGLGALAAATIGLGKNAYIYKELIMVPLINCLNEQDAKLRYTACEALYNVIKVIRQHSIEYFATLFNHLIKMTIDNDADVKNGSDIVNKLLIDIVVESTTTFDIDMIRDVVREHLYVVNPSCRQFLLTWLLVFHSKIEFNTIQCLPYWMDGILCIYDDKVGNIRRQSGTFLSELLKTIDENSSENNQILISELSLLIPILISNLQSTTNDQNHLKLMDLRWINTILKICKGELVSLLSNLIRVTIPHINYQNNENISKYAYQINELLLRQVKESSAIVKWNRFSLTLITFIDPNNDQCFNIDCCQEALYWFNFLIENHFNQIYENSENLFPLLLNLIFNESNSISIYSMKIIHKFCLNGEKEEHFNHYFNSLIKDILLKFISSEYEDDSSDHKRFIICELCNIFKPEDVFSQISNTLLALHSNGDIAREGLAKIVDLLNSILFTSETLDVLRTKIFKLNNKENCVLFCKLYTCWCYNPISTLTLCFMAQTYEHASNIIRLFDRIEIDVNFLLQIDHLVRLIESPIFSRLRLHLLNPQHQPYILYCLHSLLMLLPQSSAFATLSKRLKFVINNGNIYSAINQKWAQKQPSTKHPSLKNINFDELLQHFCSIHEKNDI